MTFEDPSSNIVGRILAGLSVFFILTSTVSFCVETLPQFKDTYPEVDLYNSSSIVVDVSWNQSTNLAVMKKPWDPSRNSFPFWVTESICIAFFTFEFIGRFLSSPDKWMFLRGMGNIIDILAVIPYYLTMCAEVMFVNINQVGCGENACSQKVAFLALLRVVRILRLMDEKLLYP